MYVVGAYIFYIRCNRSWKINRGASVLCKGGLTSKAAGTARPGTVYTYILVFKHTHTHTYIIIYSYLLMYTHAHTLGHIMLPMINTTF